MHKRYKIALLVIAGLACLYLVYKKINSSSFNPNTQLSIGQPIDSFNGVVVYYNGMVGHTGGRNLSADGYNIGMKYQCVEFAKRYYYQRLGHRMPDAYGNAKDFFDGQLPDSGFNAKRGLTQYRNGGTFAPQAEDLIIFNGHVGNPYGHVAIVTYADDTSVGIIQQNPGPFAKSRVTFRMSHTGDKWRLDNELTLGWLRRAPEELYYFCGKDSSTGGVKTKAGRVIIPAIYRMSPMMCGARVDGHEIVLGDTSFIVDPVHHKYFEKVFDREGIFLYVPFFFDNGADYYEEGLRRFAENGKIGFADRFGQKVIAAKYSFATPFNFGYAVACLDCKYTRTRADAEHCCAYTGTSFAIIDRSGKELYRLAGKEYPEINDSLLRALKLLPVLTDEEQMLFGILKQLPEVKEQLASIVSDSVRIYAVVAELPSARSPYYLFVLRFLPYQAVEAPFLVSPDGRTIKRLNLHCDEAVVEQSR